MKERKKYEVRQAEKLCASPVYIADSFSLRFRGLMMRSELAPGEGLLLKNCSSIHCFFMRFPIDVIYLDKEMKVVGKETVEPWRIGKLFKGARHVLELGKGYGELFDNFNPIELRAI